jgi:hypothetical protein
MIGVSTIASTGGGPSSPPQPALLTTPSAVVTAATAPVETAMVRTTGTTILRALIPRGLRTGRAYHRARELAHQTFDASSIAAMSSLVFAIHAASK